VWWRRRRNTHVVDEDTWDFVGGKTDQGFVYYMTRVRHRVGSDVRLSSCARESPPGVEPSYYYHYGSAGGAKPEAVVARWHSLRLKRRCYARVVPHFADNGDVLARAVGWVRRTRAEVQAALRSIASEDDETSALAKAELHACAATLESGMSCVAAAAKGGRHSYNISIPADAVAGPPRQRGAARTVSVPAEQLVAAIGNRIVSRANPLLTPARTEYGGAYVRESRYVERPHR